MLASTVLKTFSLSPDLFTLPNFGKAPMSRKTKGGLVRPQDKTSLQAQGHDVEAADSFHGITVWPPPRGPSEPPRGELYVGF